MKNEIILFENKHELNENEVCAKFAYTTSHGAKKYSWLSHLAVEVPGEETSNEWCEKVTDDVYNRLGD